MICPICGVETPDKPTDLNMPNEARCKREHSIKPDCPYEPVIAKCRGNWVLEVFKPLPPEECGFLDYIDGGR